MGFAMDVLSAAYNPRHGQMMQERERQQQAARIAQYMGSQGPLSGERVPAGAGVPVPPPQQPQQGQAGLLGQGPAPSQGPQNGLLSMNEILGSAAAGAQGAGAMQSPMGGAPQPQPPQAGPAAPLMPDWSSQYDQRIAALYNSGIPALIEQARAMELAKMGYDYDAMQAGQNLAFQREQAAGQTGALSGSDALKDLSKFSGFDTATPESKRAALDTYQQTGDLTRAHQALVQKDTQWGVTSADDLTKLGDKLADETAPNREAVTAYRQLMAGINSQTGIGDVASLFNFMKTLDPRSTVREGEIDMVNSAMPLFERLSVKIKNLTEGDLLDQQTRDEIEMLAGELMRINSDEFAAKQARTASIIPETVPENIRAYTLGRGLGWSPDMDRARKQEQATRNPAQVQKTKQSRLEELRAKQAASESARASSSGGYGTY